MYIPRFGIAEPGEIFIKWGSGDNTERKGKGVADQGGLEGGGSATIKGGFAEATQIKGEQSEKDQRQYRDKRRGNTDQGGSERGESATMRRGMVEADAINGDQSREALRQYRKEKQRL